MIVSYFLQVDIVFKCFTHAARDFVFDLIRRSNCSDPIPPGSPGVCGKMNVIEKRGALEKIVIKVIN